MTVNAFTYGLNINLDDVRLAEAEASKARELAKLMHEPPVMNPDDKAALARLSKAATLEALDTFLKAAGPATWERLQDSIVCDQVQKLFSRVLHSILAKTTNISYYLNFHLLTNELKKSGLVDCQALENSFEAHATVLAAAMKASNDSELFSFPPEVARPLYNASKTELKAYYVRRLLAAAKCPSRDATAVFQRLGAATLSWDSCLAKLLKQGAIQASDFVDIFAARPETHFPQCCLQLATVTNPELFFVLWPQISQVAPVDALENLALETRHEGLLRLRMSMRPLAGEAIVLASIKYPFFFELDVAKVASDICQSADYTPLCKSTVLNLAGLHWQRQSAYALAKWVQLLEAHAFSEGFCLFPATVHMLVARSKELLSTPHLPLSTYSTVLQAHAVLNRLSPGHIELQILWPLIDTLRNQYNWHASELGARQHPLVKEASAVLTRCVERAALLASNKATTDQVIASCLLDASLSLAARFLPQLKAEQQAAVLEHLDLALKQVEAPQRHIVIQDLVPGSEHVLTIGWKIKLGFLRLLYTTDHFEAFYKEAKKYDDPLTELGDVTPQSNVALRTANQVFSIQAICALCWMAPKTHKAFNLDLGPGTVPPERCMHMLNVVQLILSQIIPWLQQRGQLPARTITALNRAVCYLEALWSKKPCDLFFADDLITLSDGSQAKAEAVHIKQLAETIRWIQILAPLLKQERAAPIKRWLDANP